MKQGSQRDQELGGLDLRDPEKTGGSCRAGERFWKKGTEKKLRLKECDRLSDSGRAAGRGGSNLGWDPEEGCVPKGDKWGGV